YNMKFVPFIGIDNHGKCLTLGSGMLLHEDTKSYTWLLNAFMIAFSHEPIMIVTDQDGAMKRAIEAVFKIAKHRLCIPNFMRFTLILMIFKVNYMRSDRISYFKEVYDETNFKERFDKIVWNMFIEPLKFEEKWTTSRSESEISFFKSFTSPGATLVSFMMSYEFAMERQRYRQETLDFKTIDAAPKCETKLEIERHAARVYTRTIFLLVQTEIIKGCWSCTIQDLKIDEGCETVIIRDKKPNENRSLFNKKREENKRRKLKQWEKQQETIRDIIPPDLRRQRNIYGEKILTIERLTNEENFLVDDSLFLLSKDEGKMGAYVEKLKILLDEMKADMPNPPSKNTGDVISGIFSIAKPNQIAVQNPTKAVNKGEHLKKGERLKSEREKSLNFGKKKLRVCGFCKEKTNEHTKTTCLMNPKAKKRKATPVIDV
nr:hypothetical protein [Tanacetum cinerariifolium]